MLILGLSGGIASGKNLICDIFKGCNARIFDADKISHQLIDKDKAVIDAISYNFPECLIDNKIDRKVLADILFNRMADFDKKIKTLEEIIHPRIRRLYQKFITEDCNNKINFLILNIPLLIENNNYQYDKLITIDCNKNLRKKRYLNRIGCDLNKKDLQKFTDRFDLICARQVDDAKRKEKADYIIDNNNSIFSTIKQVKIIIKELAT